jgi:hypothetical protein
MAVGPLMQHVQPFGDKFQASIAYDASPLFYDAFHFDDNEPSANALAAPIGRRSTVRAADVNFVSMNVGAWNRVQRTKRGQGRHSGRLAKAVIEPAKKYGQFSRYGLQWFAQQIHLARGSAQEERGRWRRNRSP